MPLYCYTTDDGHTVERVISLRKRKMPPGFIRLDDGRIAKRDLNAEMCGFSDTPGTYPMKSDAAGVHPAQISEARRRSVKMGIPTDFTPDGRAIFTDRAHRKKYCEAVGLFDRNGGYSDPKRKARD